MTPLFPGNNFSIPITDMCHLCRLDVHYLGMKGNGEVNMKGNEDTQRECD